MQLKETVERSRTDEPVDGFGKSFVAKVQNSVRPEDVLNQIIEVWISVSLWGRWCDDELGEWPAKQQAIETLPKWFQVVVHNEAEFEIDNWLDDLHDREWVWWNGAVFGNRIKVDICAESLPISTWPIEFVIDRAGGEIMYRGDWVAGY